MKHIGPVSVYYSGPAEQQGELIGIGRVRLGLLAARRLGIPEAPLVDTITLTDRTTIRATLLDEVGVLEIYAPTGGGLKVVRRFKKKTGFVLCAKPTNRPLKYTFNGVVEPETEEGAKYLSIEEEVLYEGAEKVWGVGKGTDGDTILFVDGEPASPNPDRKTVFVSTWPLSAVFKDLGVVAYAPLCGGVFTLKRKEVPAQQEGEQPVVRYDAWGGAFSDKLYCYVGDPIIYDREIY